MRTYEMQNKNNWKNEFAIITPLGDEVVRLRAKSWWSMRAVVEGQHDQWEFKSDTWMLKYEILDRTGHPVGTAKSDWTHTKWTITLMGEPYTIKQYHWAALIYTLHNAQGTKLASVKLSHWGRRIGSLRVYGEQEPRRAELLMSLLAYIARRIQMNSYAG